MLSEWDEKINALEGQRSFNLIEKIAQPLPAMTITRILGLPIKDYELLRSKGNYLLKVLDLYLTFKDLVEIEQGAHFLVEYFEGHIKNKRKQPGKDLTSKIIRLNDAGPLPASDRELVSLCLFLFLAGEETTVSLIGNGVLNLLKHPKQLQLLRTHPEMILQAIEELLRYDSPVHVVGRIAAIRTKFRGHTIEKGDICTLCLASANRDETVFPSPDQLDITRTPNRHMAFGSGIHFCLGDWLAKRQGALAIHRLLGPEPYIHSVDETSLEWNNNLSIRSLNNLTVHSS